MLKEIRLERLAELLREHDNNKAALARAIKKAPAQVSQWFSGDRTITEVSAREIEKEAKRPHLWMDSLDDNETAATQRKALVLAEALNSLGPDARQEALDYIRFKLERAGAHTLSERLARYGGEARSGNPPIETGPDQPPPKPPSRRGGESHGKGRK